MLTICQDKDNISPELQLTKPALWVYCRLMSVLLWMIWVYLSPTKQTNNRKNNKFYLSLKVSLAISLPLALSLLPSLSLSFWLCDGQAQCWQVSKARWHGEFSPQCSHLKPFYAQRDPKCGQKKDTFFCFQRGSKTIRTHIKGVYCQFIPTFQCWQKYCWCYNLYLFQLCFSL